MAFYKPHPYAGCGFTPPPRHNECGLSSVNVSMSGSPSEERAALMRAWAGLLLIIVAGEAAIMVGFDLAGLNDPAHASLAAMLDPLLLAIIVAWPLHRWVAAPLHRRLDASVARQRLLATAMDQADEAIMVTDRRGRIEYANAAMLRMYQRPASEVLGCPAHLFEPRMSSPEWRRAFLAAIRRGETWREELRERVGERRDDASAITVEYVTAPVRTAGRITHFITIKRDLSERRELEWQLSQAQKMEVVGALAGGIAHDFNNMLAAMEGNVYLLRSMLDDPDIDRRRARDKLATMDMLIHQSAEHVRSLLSFARKGVREERVFPVGPLVKETVKLAQMRVPERICLSVTVNAEDAHTRADAVQLQQALLNLVNNAVDALEGCEDGEIAVRLERSRAAPGMLCLAVRDNGTGMSREVAARACDPYFTTKPVGKGTGLGLAMAQGFAARHGGRLEIVTRPGGGTLVRILLPEVEPDARPSESSSPADGRVPAPAASCCVLWADDDRAVRETVCEAMGRRGLRVLTARDGREALEVFLRHRERIDAAVMDVVMPRMGGVKAALRMREVRPMLPVVMLSGYDVHDEAHRAHEEGLCDRVFSKPVNPDTLADEVLYLVGRARERLDG